MIMKIVKLVVLLCAYYIEGHRNEYCQICRNHTLCKYPIGGPSDKCKGYNMGALLTDEDKAQILDRINFRRNSVATGRLDRFPQAANMNKLEWSHELARSAQRWADQCHTAVRPSIEDECRDLVDMKVGQSIAAVSGPTSGLSVRSFVDVWFMMKLRFTGTFVYYNQSQDEKTNHFTQLIWANTEYVGCGKVKFFNEVINNVVERLVCNFAPKGNNHGKPVYTMGYPATQCPEFMEPDYKYPGLCTRLQRTETIENSSIGSLLRINLSNNSTKQEIKPNNIRQINPNARKISKAERNQKTRHVYINNPYGAVKRDSFHMRNPMNEANKVKSSPFTPEGGHSRLYQGHQPQKTLTVPNTPPHHTSSFIADPDIRRYELIQTPRTFSGNSFRRDFIPVTKNQICTRRHKGCVSDCHTTQYVTNKCTRGEPQTSKSEQLSHSCNLYESTLSSALLTHEDSCPCNKHSKYHTTPKQCICISKCNCCAKESIGDDPEESKTTQFNYRDLFPDIGVRSGDDNPFIKHFVHPEAEDENYARDMKLSHQVKEVAVNFRTRTRSPQDSYDIFYSSERKRRDFEDQVTFKPFWEMDEYNNNKRPRELKSLRYTTLSGNKGGRKTRRNTYSRIPTESITIQFDNDYNQNSDHITEKYLSFEELMRLRKFTTLDEFEYDARRGGNPEYRRQTKETVATTTAAVTKNPAVTTKPAVTKKAAVTTEAAVTTKAPVTTKKPVVTTKAPITTLKTVATTKAPITTTRTTKPTTTITANTPFIRLKQCTRKLTCTWTAVTFKFSDGHSVVAGGGGLDLISRTPPGYVEGCSRTSTCTRDFMDRNKMESTTGEPEHEVTEESTPTDDEDYCERRKRNLDSTENQFLSIDFQRAFTEKPVSTPKVNHNNLVSRESVTGKNNWREPRIKRHDRNSYFDQLINKSCNGEKRNKLPENINDEQYHSKKIFPPKFKTRRRPCACNKSIPNTFYSAIILIYVLTWTCYDVFMNNFNS